MVKKASKKEQVTSDTKEKILRKARDLFLEQGAPGLSMRKIAKEVGLTPMAIYRHFANKEDLQKELMGRAFRTFGEYLYPALEKKTPLERLRATSDGFLYFALAEQKGFELIYLAIDPINNIKVSREIRKESLPTFHFLKHRIRDCIQAGIFTRGKVSAITVSFLAQSTGLCALYLGGSFGWSETTFKRVYKESIDSLLLAYSSGKEKS